MSERRFTALPEQVWSAFVGLAVFGILLGGLYGFDVISEAALYLALFAGITVFVPWAAVKLDPRGLREIASDLQNRNK